MDVFNQCLVLHTERDGIDAIATHAYTVTTDTVHQNKKVRLKGYGWTAHLGTCRWDGADDRTTDACIGTRSIGSSYYRKGSFDSGGISLVCQFEAPAARDSA